jgi:hypothetical protein
MCYLGHTSTSQKLKILLPLHPDSVLIDREDRAEQNDDACGVRTHALSNWRFKLDTGEDITVVVQTLL